MFENANKTIRIHGVVACTRFNLFLNSFSAALFSHSHIFVTCSTYSLLRCSVTLWLSSNSARSSASLVSMLCKVVSCVSCNAESVSDSELFSVKSCVTGGCALAVIFNGLILRQRDSHESGFLGGWEESMVSDLGNVRSTSIGLSSLSI